MTLNGNLLALAHETEVHYIDNPKSLFLSNGEVNDGYLYDNVHINIKGANKLAQSMGLKGNNKNVMDMCSVNASQSSPMSWTNKNVDTQHRTSQHNTHYALANGSRNADHGPGTGATKNCDTKLNSKAATLNDSFDAPFWATARGKVKRHTHKETSYAQVTRSENRVIPDYCLYCGEENHATNQCRHRKKVQCHDCERLGHKSKFCYMYWDHGQKDWPWLDAKLNKHAPNSVMKWLKRKIDSDVVWSYFEIKTSPSDGHCFIYSVISSSTAHLWKPLFVEYTELLAKVEKETIENVALYAGFLVDENQTRLLDDMHRYLRDKIYETPFGDLVPLIVANALQTKIIIIEDKLTRKVIREVKPFDVGNASHLLILYKNGDHYDACVPINDRANVNDRIARPLCKDRQSKCVQDKVPEPSGICSSVQRKSKSAGKLSTNYRRLDNIKFGHINSRSLYPKKDEMEFIMTKNDFDIFCISH